ncbi:MAG: aminodeoxychorismate/anthranilate synthase component II [Pseudomonadota bacterium]
MIIVIDNYDSFSDNLARYVREAGAGARLLRNDAESVDTIVGMRPAGVILSPGPGAPKDAGVCLSLLSALPATTPLLGVCLGHLCLVEACGGATIRAAAPLHGEASLVRHTREGIFEDVASPTPVGRYHALIGAPAPSSPLKQTAWTDDGAVMAVAHEARPWFGVQFHPESLLTLEGRRMIDNFLRQCTVKGARP